MSLKNILVAAAVSVASLPRAIEDLKIKDDGELASIFSDLTGGMSVATDNLLNGTKYAVQAVINDVDTPERVAEFVAKKVALLPKAAPVVVAAVVAEVDGLTVSEVVATGEEASEEVADEAAPAGSMNSLIATSEPTVAKRGRGRPKLTETAYDRAVAVMNAATTRDRGELTKLLVASGVNKSSAAVYAWRAGKQGDLTSLSAPTADAGDEATA